MDQIRELIDGWLHETGQGIGQPLGLNEDNLCSLQYEDDLEINVELAESGRWLYLHAPVAHVGMMQSAEFFREILKISLFGLQTDGAVLGYDERSDRIAISHRVDPTPLDGLAFVCLLEKFVVTAARIRNDVTRRMAMLSPPDSPVLEENNDGMMRV